MQRSRKIADIRQRIAVAERSEDLDTLFGEWAALVKSPRDRIDYCEDRLQYLETYLEEMNASTFTVYGRQVKSEIAWLKAEIRKQERAIRLDSDASTHLNEKNGIERSAPRSEVLVWNRTLADLAKLIHTLIEERCLDRDRIDYFVSKHIQLRDDSGNVEPIDRKKFSAMLRQFKSPTGTAKGSEKINQIIDDRVIKRRKE